MTTNEETFKALKEFIEARGYPPTVRELGEALGLSSPDSTHERLQSLERAGMIERVPGSPRAIILKETPRAS